MSRLQDVFIFDTPAAPAPPPRMTHAEYATLAGIGNREGRQAQDYFADLGIPLVTEPIVETKNGRFSSGDDVEFVNMDGFRIAGRISELSETGALVTVGEGEHAFIPHNVLEHSTRKMRVEAKRDEIRAVLQHGRGAAGVTETRAPIPVNASGRDFAITLQGASIQRPTEDEILAFIAFRYPGARVLDADGSYPGNKIGVVIHLPNGLPKQGQGMIPIVAPNTPPNDRREAPGISQEFVDDTPAKIAEEMARRNELVGRTGRVLVALAEANAAFDFFETNIEVESTRALSHFAIYQNGSPVFIRRGAFGVELTPVLGVASAPAIGYVAAANDASTFTALFAPDGEIPITRVRNLVARDDMFSPGSLSREDAPGAYEHGSYVTKADASDAMPAEADHDIEGAPPKRDVHNYYTKQQWDKELARYHDEQQQQLLQQERRKQLRTDDPSVPIPTTSPDWLEAPSGTPPIGNTPTPDWLEETPVQQPAVTRSPRPDWLEEEKPAWQRVKSDAESEHLGGPGLQVAERREGVDETAKEYWDEEHGYFTTPETKGYGKALTKDIVTKAWKEAGKRITAAQLFKTLQIFMTQNRVAQEVHDLPSSLLYSRRNDPSAANAVDKLVADYLARNPEVLDEFGVYDQALTKAVEYWEMMQPKRLEKLRQKYAPEQAEVGTAHDPGPFLSPQQRVEREIETGLGMKSPRAPEQSAPAPDAPEPGAEDPSEMNLEFEPDPEPPSAPPAAPEAPAAPLKQQLEMPVETTRKPRKPKSENFTPSPEMKVFDDRGQPRESPPPGSVLTKFPSGAVRYRSSDGEWLTAFPPGVETPAGGGAGAPASGGGAGPPAGIGERIKKRLLGAERQAYRSPTRGDADDPSPETYAEETPTDAYAGRRPPAFGQLGFKLENVRRSGDYIVGDVVWDTDQTEAMSAKNIEQNIVSFVKGRSTMKDPFDLGNIGRVRVRKLDLHTGLAEVIFRSSEARAVPPEQIVIEEGVTHG